MEAIEEYLNTGPWNGRKLRKEMKRVGFCLSGSKALWCTLGLAGSLMLWRDRLQKSDWDFYTDGTVKSIGDTIESLESLGVEFQTLLGSFNARIERSIRQGQLLIGVVDLSMFYRHWIELQSDRDYNDHPLVDTLFAQLGESYLEPLRNPNRCRYQRKLIDFSTETSLLVYIDMSQRLSAPDDERHSLLGRDLKHTSYSNLGLTVIEGLGQGGIPIQVIAKANQTAEAVIMQFHSSIVQCFVGGNGAAHLYGNLAAKSQSYFWHENRQSPVKARQAKEKYERRGFRYIRHPSGNPQALKMRALSDNEAIRTPASAKPSQKCVPPLDLEWLECAGRTKLTNPRRLPLTEEQPNRHFWRHVNSLYYSSQIRTQERRASRIL